MYKNIIYITGNDSYGIEKELQRWLGAFVGKYGDINIDRYDLSERESLSNIRETLLMGGLFVEKRLFIFRGGRDKKSKSEGLESILISHAAEIPSDHFLLFHNVSPRETGLIEWLMSHADVRSIDTLWDQSVWEKRYSIHPEYISRILSLYRKNESLREKDDINPLLGHEIAQSCELIDLALASNRSPDPGEIETYCTLYGGDTLFGFTDALLSYRIPEAYVILQRIITKNRADEWIASLIGLLRNNLYILALRSRGVAESQISSYIKIHPFVLKKGYQSRIPYTQLELFYKKLIHINIAYKRGKGMKDNELGRVLAIELVLMGLQKTNNP